MEEREIAYFNEKHFFLGSDVGSSILASKQYFLLIMLIILDGGNHLRLKFSHVLVWLVRAWTMKKCSQICTYYDTIMVYTNNELDNI